MPDDEIEEVRKEETRRKRAPKDDAKIEERRHLKREIAGILRGAETAEELRAALVTLGVPDDSPQLEEAIRLWRASRPFWRRKP
jgi:hypothetical protein